MKAPTHLLHKPIIEVKDYDKIDAQYANSTDVKALSIGEAQYDRNHISLKTWRHTGKKWSRLSEEIPIHRNIDLTILLIGALLTDINSNYPTTNLRENIVDKTKVKDILTYYKQHKKFLRPRLLELQDKLDDFLKRNF
jgi:hypothetical protein